MSKDISFDSSEAMQALRQSSLFEPFSDEVRQRFVSLARGRQYDANEILFVEMAEGDEIYLLLDGSVGIQLALANAEYSYEIVIRGVGSILGEIAFVEQGQRSATVTAKSDLRVLVWSCDDWRKICDEDNAIGYRLVMGLAKILCARLRESNVRILNEVSWGLV